MSQAVYKCSKRCQAAQWTARSRGGLPALGTWARIISPAPLGCVQEVGLGLRRLQGEGKHLLPGGKAACFLGNVSPCLLSTLNSG